MPVKTNLRELVLVGGGHSHVQVLRGFAMQPPPDARITLVVDVPIAVYSGMVPGFVAGQYRADELEIDVLPLGRRCGARVIMAPAIGIDSQNRRIELAGRPSIPYDLASIDIGSTVSDLDLPGVRERAIPTRPIGRFVQRVDQILGEIAHSQGNTPLVIVGGGAGGVELAFTLEQRARMELGRRVRTVLIHGGGEILTGYSTHLVRRIRANAERRGIEIFCSQKVIGAEDGAVLLDGGETLTYAALVWVTGAIGHPLARDSGLPTGKRGFLRIRSTLEVEGHKNLFAVGDCATLIDHPRTPKAGVYAVRQGPLLIHNLRAALRDEPLRAYRPQGDFLTLLNLGDGRAVGAKWGRSFEGRWVMRLKDTIDRRFMRRFQVLNPDGSLTAEFARPFVSMDPEDMVCGGCAAKLSQLSLESALSRLETAAEDPEVEVGLAAADDAAVFRTSAGRTVSTVDAFPDFTDDPYLVGRVAATNALSDLYAMGAQPRFAQALITVPANLGPEAAQETLYQVLAGARETFLANTVTLLGGHTTTGPKLTVGFQAEGHIDEVSELLRLDRLQRDQALILSKPLGTGVLFRADGLGRARGPWIERALESMLRSNAEAARIALTIGATSATDVTGFGLAGHLVEMLRASGLSATIHLDELPTLAGAIELLAQGMRSTSHAANEASAIGLTDIAQFENHQKLPLVFDPQTSGGLLFGVPADQARQTIQLLRDAGDLSAASVGETDGPRQNGKLVQLVSHP